MKTVVAPEKKKPHQQGASPPTPSDVVASIPANGVVPREHIEQLAYQKWEAAGKPCCDGSAFWEEAEKELQQQR